MAEKLLVDPKQVWSFYNHLAGVSTSLLNFVKDHGWENIPPIPVFSIPESSFYERQHNYMALDGCSRLKVAEHLGQKINILVFNRDEEINSIILGLAPSKILTHLERFERLLKGYALRDRIQK